MRVESVLSEEERDRKFNKFKKMRGQSDVEMQPPPQQQQEPQPLQHHQQQQQQQLTTTTSSSPLNWTEMDLSSEPLVLTEESDLMRDVKVVVPKKNNTKRKKMFSLAGLLHVFQVLVLPRQPLLPPRVLHARIPWHRRRRHKEDEQGREEAPCKHAERISLQAVPR